MGCLGEEASFPRWEVPHQGLSWTSFRTFWGGRGTELWAGAQAPSITEAPAGVGVGGGQRGQRSAGRRAL